MEFAGKQRGSAMQKVSQRASRVAPAALLAGMADLEAPALVAAPRLDLVGDAGSIARVGAMRQAIQALKFRTHAPLLNRALDAVTREDYALGSKLGLKALARDAELGLAWHVLAICREKAGDFPWALRCYRSAFELMPDQTAIAHDLARLAHMMDEPALAEKLYRIRVVSCEGEYLDSLCNLALLLKDQMRHEEAIEELRPYIVLHPEHMLLWNTLASVVFDQGDIQNAEIFFSEAIKLAPDFGPALYNRSNARSTMGDTAGALHDVDKAIEVCVSPSQKVQFELGRAFRRLDAGDLPGGWDSYEARLDPIYFPNDVYNVPLPRWTPEADLVGRRLLVVAEQGLGDEVMFANLIDDVLAALGPGGAMTLAVEPRLVKLFQRSWPSVHVTEHRTVKHQGRVLRYVPTLSELVAHDLWTPLASLLRRFRSSIGSFPMRPAFLTPDPSQASRWRTELDALGPQPKVGVVWKSIKITSDRKKLYSPFSAWGPILRTTPATFVDLQYGVHDEDIAYAREQFGVQIWRPPGLDLKDDLDGLTALASVLDLAIGPANASTNLAAAAGTPVWLIAIAGAWPKLGTERYPWYPRTRVFSPPSLGNWDPVITEVAAALAEQATPAGREIRSGRPAAA